MSDRSTDVYETVYWPPPGTPAIPESLPAQEGVAPRPPAIFMRSEVNKFVRRRTFAE